MLRLPKINLLIVTAMLALATGVGAADSGEATDDGPGWRIAGFFRELVGYLKRSDQIDEGDPAPDFVLTPLQSYELERVEANGAVRLSSFKGVKPVALVFGSYT